MTIEIEKIKSDLSALIEQGFDLRDDLKAEALGEKKKKGKVIYTQIFLNNFQKWYTEAHALVGQLLPDRLAEFELMYLGDGKRKTFDIDTITIQDWMLGKRAKTNVKGEKVFNDAVAVVMRFNVQLEIVISVKKKFDSSLFNIKHIVQANLFDSELDAARELLINGFTRAAGAMAGVVLEKHLKQICEDHKAIIKTKIKTISVLNDSLKKLNIIDISTWRFIQRLGDLRNLCDHDDRDPKEEEITDLINGVEKILKTVF
jgi:hypothetical protein